MSKVARKTLLTIVPDQPDSAVARLEVSLTVFQQDRLGKIAPHTVLFALQYAQRPCVFATIDESSRGDMLQA